MVNEIIVNEFDNLLNDVCLRTNIEGMEDCVLKIALQHYVQSDCNQANHRDRHTDHSDCTCLIGGI